MLHTRAVALSALGLCSLAGGAWGQASLTVIRPPAGQRDLVPYGLSADGAWVTGFTYQPTSEPNFSPFRWSAATGVTFLATPDGLGGDGFSISGNGQVVVGQSAGRAYRWTPSGGAQVVLPVLSSANDVSTDGNRFIGEFNNQGFLATATGLDTLEPLAGMETSRAKAISGNGGTSVGVSERSGFGYGPPGAVFMTPTRWVGFGGVPQAIPTQPVPWQNGYAVDVSADGAVTVGVLVRDSQGETQAFRNTSAGTLVIPTVCDASMAAVAVNGDGSVVVGDSACGPWVWDSVRGTRLIAPLLTGVIPAGLTLSFARGVSADGQTVLGEGNLGSGFAPVGFVAHLPASTNCTADFNGDGDVGTDQDIEAFFRCLAGTCCASCGTADFNNDGDVGTDQDIESFFRVLAGGAC